MKRFCFTVAFLFFSTFVFYRCALPQEGTISYYENKAIELGQYVEQYNTATLNVTAYSLAYQLGYANKPVGPALKQYSLEAREKMPAILQEIRRIRKLIPKDAKIDAAYQGTLKEADEILKGRT